jgi:hypothetical protein
MIRLLFAVCVNVTSILITHLTDEQLESLLHAIAKEEIRRHRPWSVRVAQDGSVREESGRPEAPTLTDRSLHP